MHLFCYGRQWGVRYSCSGIVEQRGTIKKDHSTPSLRLSKSTMLAIQFILQPIHLHLLLFAFSRRFGDRVGLASATITVFSLAASRP